MNFVLKPGRPMRRLWSAFGVAALALLASCGGGTLENAFSPSRLVVFGDEASVITQTNSTGPGLKYSVNYFDTTATPPAISCGLYPVWTQYLANALNLPFAACAAPGANAPSVMRAALGAQVSDVAAQINTQVAAGGFTRADLVTIMVGANDIWAQYNLYAAGTQDFATSQATLTQRAITVASLVQQVISTGGKVLVATVPNQGLTPAGLANAQMASDLTTLSAAYNNALRTALVDFSGRDVGLILASEIVRLDSAFPGSYNFSNVSNAMCATPDTASLLSVPCTNLTLASGISDASTYLWAGNTMLGPTANGQIGSEAYSRATNNPF